MEDGPSSSRLHARRRHRRERYRLRILCCLAASLLLMVAAARLWPSASSQPVPAPATYDNEAVALHEITQTRHAKRRAAPPPPPVPLFETDDFIEQEPLDLSVELAPDRSPSDAPPGPTSTRDGAAETPAASAPQVGARLFQNPELNYTEAARRKDIRARVDVEVVIAPTGRVEAARIVRRVLLSGENAQTQRAVSSLGYGLEEAALDAARHALFRPARAGGKAVESRKTLTLTFGPGE